MTDRALTINLDTFAGKETPWIHLIQEGVSTDEINHKQAADIIDEAFGIVPCFEGGQSVINETIETEQEGGLVQEIWDKVNAILKRVAGATFCEQHADGGWNLVIRAAVSDITLPYTLLIDGGIQGTVQTVMENVSGTKLVENASQFTFDYPVLDSIDFKCPVPFAVDGSTVYFEESVTTYFVYSYATQYDRVTITTKPEYTESDMPSVQGGILDLRKYDNGQVGQLIEKLCTVTGLYSGRSRQITLELPEVDESIEEPESICLTEGGMSATGGSRVCYEEITHITKCQCNDKIYPDNNLRTEKIVVPCPKDIVDCPAIRPGCTSIVSRTDRHHYVACPNIDSPWDGDTLEFYEEKCCESPKISLPECKIKTTSYVGNKSIKEDEQYWIDRYSYANVTFHPVTPQGGICGKTIVEQVLTAKNCCEGVAILELDTENSAATAPENGQAIVYLLGGTTPITWKVRGDGFYTDSNHLYRDAVTTSKSLIIYTKDSCGPCQIYATDGCSSIEFTILGFVGEWQKVWDGGVGAPPMIPPGSWPITEYIRYIQGMAWFAAYSGKYRLEIPYHYAILLPDLHTGDTGTNDYDINYAIWVAKYGTPAEKLIERSTAHFGSKPADLWMDWRSYACTILTYVGVDEGAACVAGYGKHSEPLVYAYHGLYCRFLAPNPLADYPDVYEWVCG